MKNKGIVIFLILLAVVIVAVIAGDWYSKRPDKMEANPYEYSVDEFKNVPEELIHYRETKNFRISFEEPAGITIDKNLIYLVGDLKLQIIDLTGKLVKEISLSEKPKTVEVADGKIFIGGEKEIQMMSPEGDLQKEWELPGEKAYITAVAVTGDNVFVADAGARKVFRYDLNGNLINEFEGKASEDVLHGFIVPSPYFDMDINADGNLWVVNPGLHELENYTFDGNLREFWRSSNILIDGFSGCCNPAHFTFLQNGSFVTSEKGLVRVKMYKPSGEFSGVVAAPVKFDNEEEAPDVAVDSKGNIYLLDFGKKVIRVFEPKTP